MTAGDESPLVIDGRYRGHHGIARYAAEVVPRLRDRLRAEVLDSGEPGRLDFLSLGRRLRTSGSALFYSPGYHAALLTSVRQILTVHDVIHLDMPSERSALKEVYYRQVVRPAVRRSGVVFTVSEFSRRRLADRLDLDPHAVVVTGNGCSDAFLQQVDTAPRARPYVVCVTNGKPYKNFSLMARAVAALPPDWSVTCVGISAEAALPHVPARFRGRFRFSLGISDVELRTLYAGAVALALPARMEGFGLPAVEAMAQGTPVVYCAEAVDEVTRGTGFRVTDADDHVAFAGALVAAAGTDPGRRVERIDIARQHTWDEVATRVLRVLIVEGAPVEA